MRGNLKSNDDCEAVLGNRVARQPHFIIGRMILKAKNRDNKFKDKMVKIK